MFNYASRPPADQAKNAPILLQPSESAAPAFASGRSFSRISIGAVQPKLTVNTPGDSYEQEADAMADSVIRGGAQPVSTEASPSRASYSFSQVPILSGQMTARSALSVQRELPEGGVPDEDAPDGGVPNNPAPAPAPTPAPTPTPAPGADDGNLVPQLSTPTNDLLGTALGLGGLLPGIPGKIFTGLGGLQSATQQPTKGSDSEDSDRLLQAGSLGTTAAGLGLLGEGAAMAAGPIGLALTGIGAASHYIPELFKGMIEGGVQSNPGQFGPDPMDSLNSGQGY